MRSAKDEEDWLELKIKDWIIQKLLTKLVSTGLPNVHGGEK